MPDAKLTIGQKTFLALLAIAGVVVINWAIFRSFAGPTVPNVVPGKNLVGEVRDYLGKRRFQPLSAPLEQSLADPTFSPVASQPHPLLGQPAPAVALLDPDGKTWNLKEADGPIVLVFYFGYHCNHCVGQLFALNDDVARFGELGAKILSISADSPELTRERFKKYGAFAFPVLSDRGNKVAQTYGVYQPASGAKADNLLHGTFLIDRAGVVRWANLGDEPFTDNRSLLFRLAEMEGRVKARP